MSKLLVTSRKPSPCDREIDRELLERTREYLACRASRHTPGPCETEAWERFYGLCDLLVGRFALACGLPMGELNDCRQEVWKVLVATLPNFRYDAARGGFRSWLFCLVRRKTIDVIRRQTRHRAEHLDSDWEVAIPARDSDPAYHFEQHCDRAAVHRALDELRNEVSEATFQAIYMWWIDRRPIAEIAAASGLTPRKIWQRVYRAKQKLRCLLLQRTRND